MKKITHKEWLAEAEAKFGKDPKGWKFICPVCKTVQSIQDFLDLGVDKETIQGQIGFSCIGRQKNSGPWKKKDKPGKGCDWTLGGLFQFHTLEIQTDDGKSHPQFEFAAQ